MDQPDEMSLIAAEFRRHFDQYYLGVIPRLLNDEGTVLAFVSLLTAVECLAGAYRPNQGSGERFRSFIRTYFPDPYKPFAEQLWQFRNRMVHSFNPSPFAIVCHQSRMHLVKAGQIPVLNAEDFYADVVVAARRYFTALYSDLELQKRFEKRINDNDGGRIKPLTILESIDVKGPAV
ncbi:MAG: hypothetical protein IPL59_04170 [Candidatus Competibacteraceae bacterium]|nr:hypothetical protein [Candidatus Competibacteraceae bacterium]MBK8751840.1 hypothetical protein [Candidatus Competibacteraceae bacterium]